MKNRWRCLLCVNKGGHWLLKFILRRFSTVLLLIMSHWWKNDAKTLRGSYYFSLFVAMFCFFGWLSKLKTHLCTFHNDQTEKSDLLAHNNQLFFSQFYQQSRHKVSDLIKADADSHVLSSCNRILAAVPTHGWNSCTYIHHHPAIPCRSIGSRNPRWFRWDVRAAATTTRNCGLLSSLDALWEPRMVLRKKEQHACNQLGSQKIRLQA